MANIPTTVQQHGPHTVVTGVYAATYTLDASTVPVIADVAIALTGNLALQAPTNPKPGQRIRFWLTASAANRTLTLNAAVKSPALLDVAGAGAGIIATGKVRMVEIAHNGTEWHVVNQTQAV
jgi:hypothetical protein